MPQPVTYMYLLVEMIGIPLQGSNVCFVPFYYVSSCVLAGLSFSGFA